MEKLRTLALELLRRQPAAFADIVSGEIPAGDGLEPPNYPPPDDENVPEWCKYGHCVAMPTQEENKCVLHKIQARMHHNKNNVSTDCFGRQYIGHCYAV